MGYRVLLDFDGTIAPDDPTDRLLDQFADPGWRILEAEWQAGRLTSRECMQRQAAMLRASPVELDAAIGTIRLDPGFHGFVAFCGALGIEMSILSDGFDRVVDGALRQAGLPIRYFANALEWQGGDRWRLELPHRHDACRVDAANCKCAHATWADGRTIVIGDGRSDFCMAARADYVIAKGSLLDFCRTRAVPYASFKTFDDATRHLSAWLDLQSGRPASPAPLWDHGHARSTTAPSS